MKPPRMEPGCSLWQHRYWEHQIRDNLDLQRHADYIHYNPVKHGHVARVVDWPYSSFYRYVKAGIYPPDWAGGVNDMQDVGEYQRTCTRDMGA